ncbi:gamma carbonic anhydrase family protein [Sulfobacillus thermosulfidooxidans]|uniref:gamma carbonic anhydrase family protein n=1 Tax=Sulfobacillus thermosulfidooxidans TaxID=28034 RepID=UPI0003FF632A|nr:gamma carbonic anhydrase family protein [Sulfobacillus thermosulfidooxidans]
MLLKFGEFYPEVGQPIFVAPGSYIIGQVMLGDYVSVWFNAVIRADSAPITIGAGTNIQDNVSIHADPGFPCSIGQNVTVGHNAVIHGAQIASEVLVGMGAIVMNGAKIHPRVLIAAGSLIPQGMEVPEGMLVQGRPARVVRALTEQEIDGIVKSAQHYQQLWIKQGWHFR